MQEYIEQLQRGQGSELVTNQIFAPLTSKLGVLLEDVEVDFWRYKKYFAQAEEIISGFTLTSWNKTSLAKELLRQEIVEDFESEFDSEIVRCGETCDVLLKSILDDPAMKRYFQAAGELTFAELDMRVATKLSYVGDKNLYIRDLPQRTKGQGLGPYLTSIAQTLGAQQHTPTIVAYIDTNFRSIEPFRKRPSITIVSTDAPALLADGSIGPRTFYHSRTEFNVAMPSHADGLCMEFMYYAMQDAAKRLL